MWLPFRRRAADQPADPVAPLDVATTGEGAVPGWHQLPPLRPATQPTVLAPGAAFRTGLAAARPFPLAMGPLNHGIDPEAPSGMADGLAVAVASQRSRDELVLAPSASRRSGPPADEGAWWPIEPATPVNAQPASLPKEPVGAQTHFGGGPELQLRPVAADDVVAPPLALTMAEGDLRPLPGRYRSAASRARVPEATTAPEPLPVAAQPANHPVPTGPPIVRRTLGESRKMGLGPPMAPAAAPSRADVSIVSEPKGLEAQDLPLVARMKEASGSGEAVSKSSPGEGETADGVAEPSSDATPAGAGDAAGHDQPSGSEKAPLVGARLRSGVVLDPENVADPTMLEAGVGSAMDLSMPLIELSRHPSSGSDDEAPGGDAATAALVGDTPDTAPLVGDAARMDAGGDTPWAGSAGEDAGAGELGPPPPDLAGLTVARSPIHGGLPTPGDRFPQTSLDAGGRHRPPLAPHPPSGAGTPRQPIGPRPPVRRGDPASAGLPVVVAGGEPAWGPAAPGIGPRLGMPGWDLGATPSIAAARATAAPVGSRRLGAPAWTSGAATALRPAVGASAATGTAGHAAWPPSPELTLQRAPTDAAAPPSAAALDASTEVGRLLAEIGSTSGVVLAPDGSLSFSVPTVPATATTGPSPASEPAPAASRAGDAGSETAPSEGSELSEAKLDDLARKLYDRIRRRLKLELLVDRERAGMASDLR